MGQCPYVALWPPLHLAGFCFIFQLLWWGLGRQKTPRLYENTGMLGGNCSKLCLCSSCLACLYPGCVASGSLGGAYSPGCSESLGEAFAPEKKKKANIVLNSHMRACFSLLFAAPSGIIFLRNHRYTGWEYFFHLAVKKQPLECVTWIGVVEAAAGPWGRRLGHCTGPL